MTGRIVDITLELTDKPGGLQNVSKIIADLGANVVSVNHDRAEINSDINSCYLKLSMETRDHGHILAIKKALKEQGYNIIN